MIALFTDFGLVDPYVGEMHAVLARLAPGTPVIDLFNNVPCFDVKAGAYLLPAYTRNLPERSVTICVIDPGVGGARAALMLEADGRWYVGPDNGLFTLVARRAHNWHCYVIDWRPEKLSASFHGRDLFAPVAAQLIRGERPQCHRVQDFAVDTREWPDDLLQVLYVDRYGNAITGMRTTSLANEARLICRGQDISYARTFSERTPGEAFWYDNANGLVEIAVNQGSAADTLGLQSGDRIGLK